MNDFINDSRSNHDLHLHKCSAGLLPDCAVCRDVISSDVYCLYARATPRLVSETSYVLRLSLRQYQILTDHSPREY